MKKTAIILSLFALALLWSTAQAEDDTYVVPTRGYEPVETLDIVYPQRDAPSISVQLHEGKAYLFLPSGAQGGTLLIGGEAVSCDLSAGEHTLTDAEGQPLTLTIMHSANLRAVYVTSDNPVNEGRAYIDGSQGHTTVTSGSLILQNQNGTTDYRGKIEKFRGRGNTTWGWGYKKPYQLKLQDAALLEGACASKTYLLLADCFDATLLHNTLCLDMAQKLGIPAPRHEQVDFYYDGVYRGTYLMTEKVEVRDGLLDIMDTNKALEKVYGNVVPQTVVGGTEDGVEYQYSLGVESTLNEKAAYLLELDENNFGHENSWIKLKSNLHFVVLNPKLLSQSDALYIGTLLQQIENALTAGGTDPQTGAKITDLLDDESMARFFLLSEWSKNPDYWRTSTFFYKPQNDHKLYAGPVWDFDIAFGVRIWEEENSINGYLRADESWLKMLCALPGFQETVRGVWERDFQPALDQLDLQPYIDHIAASAAMNFTLWPCGGQYNNINWDTLYDTWQENLDFLQQYLTGRLAWMTDDIAWWMGHSITAAELSLTYRNADVENSATLAPVNVYSNVTLSNVVWQAETDPDAAWNNRYTLDVTLNAAAGCAFTDDFALNVNGDPVPVVVQNSSTAAARFAFSGPRYEPALYDDVDYGMIFQPDFFAEMNPDEAEECGYDPEAMLAYFVENGLYEELQGIETYVSQEYIENDYDRMDAYFMCDPASCAQYYMENWKTENLLGMAEEGRPRVEGLTPQPMATAATQEPEAAPATQPIETPTLMLTETPAQNPTTAPTGIEPSTEND